MDWFSLAALGLALGTTQTSTGSSVDSARALMAGLAQVERLEADYEETKTLAVLKRPLRSRGQLFYRRHPAAAMARVQQKPQAARVLVRANELATYRPGQRPERLSFEGRPELRALVGSLLALLEGNLAELQKAYTVRFTTVPEGWVLELTPKSERLSAMVRRLQFRGRGLAVSSFRVEEARGDSTETKILAATLEPDWTPEIERSRFEGP